MICQQRIQGEVGVTHTFFHAPASATQLIHLLSLLLHPSCSTYRNRVPGNIPTAGTIKENLIFSHRPEVSGHRLSETV